MGIGEQARIRLCQASGHDHPSIGVESPRAPRKLETLGVSAIRHGAGIDDIDIRSLVEIATLHAERTEARLDYRRVVLVDLASERRDGKPHPATPAALVR